MMTNDDGHITRKTHIFSLSLCPYTARPNITPARLTNQRLQRPTQLFNQAAICTSRARCTLYTHLKFYISFTFMKIKHLSYDDGIKARMDLLELLQSAFQYDARLDGQENSKRNEKKIRSQSREKTDKDKAINSGKIWYAIDAAQRQRNGERKVMVYLSSYFLCRQYINIVFLWI